MPSGVGTQTPKNSQNDNYCIKSLVMIIEYRLKSGHYTKSIKKKLFALLNIISYPCVIYSIYHKINHIYINSEKSKCTYLKLHFI